MTATGTAAHAASDSSAAPPARKGTAVYLLGVATVATLLPFVAKPFNVDDPFYLAVARHITTAPLDFYGFEFNWYGTLEPVTYANHAPASAYFMALVGLVAGWGEPAMHIAFMLPAIGLMLGTYALASRLCDQPVLASLAAWLCPAVFVSATSVMTDVFMACFFVWAIVLWMRGIDEKRGRWLLAGAAMASLAGLMKFFGVTVIGLFAVYALGRRYPSRRWAPFLGVPILVLALYEGLTHALYGEGLVSGSFGFAGQGRNYAAIPVREWVACGLSFTGGGLFAVALMALAAWPRRMWIVWGIAFASAAAAFSQLEWYRGLALRREGTVEWTAVIHLAGFITLGANLVAFSLWRLLRTRSLEEVLLVCWMAGVLSFSTLINWSVTARTLVPIAPAAAILVIRATQARRPATRLNWCAAGIGAVVALVVAWGDLSWSRSAKSMAEHFNQTFGRFDMTVYYQGHWGFQHYADPKIMTALDVENTVLHAGDIIVTPTNNSVYPLLPMKYVSSQDHVLVGEGRWANTMLGPAGVGFYTNLFGPLPFRLGPSQPEVYIVSELGPEIESMRFRAALAEEG